MKLPIIIEAASRYKLGTPSILKVGKKELILKQIDKLNTLDDSEIYIVTGEEHEYIKSICPEYNIVRNKDYKKYNTAYSVGLAMSKLRTKRALIVLGNTYFNKPTINFKFDKKSTLIINGESCNSIGCIYNTKLENIFYDLPNKWSGLLYVTKETFSTLKRICMENPNMYLFEAINILAQIYDIDVINPKSGRAVIIDEISKIEIAKGIR